jgi:hypothetical protein
LPSRSIRLSAVAAFLAVIPLPISAIAQEDVTIPAGLIVPPNAPAIMQSCRLTYPEALMIANVVVGNRTRHTMTGADVTFVAYDSENTKIWQGTQHLGLDGGVLSADTGAQRLLVDVNLNAVGGHKNLLSKISCEVTAATFTAGKQWQIGERWPEAIVPIQSAQMTMENGEQGAGSPARSTRPKLSVSVVNSWTDNQAGVLIVHDTVAIAAGDTDVTVHPQDLLLTMTLAGGARKAYLGLAHSAPQYLKTIPGVGSTMVPEVSPASDLGAIGAIIVPAHSSATTTVTFLIGDVVATPTDNRAVSVR